MYGCLPREAMSAGLWESRKASGRKQEKEAASKERQNWKRGKGRLGRQDNPDMTRLPREHRPRGCGGQVRRPPGWEEACLPGGELKKIAFH